MKTTRFIVSTKNKCAISTNVPISFNYIFITYGESFSFVSFVSTIHFLQPVSKIYPLKRWIFLSFTWRRTRLVSSVQSQSDGRTADF